MLVLQSNLNVIYFKPLIFLKNEIHQKMIGLNLTENFRLILGFSVHQGKQ